MAVLQKIRNRGPLLVGVIAVALAAFVIGDGLRGGEGLMQQSKQIAGKINGESVSIQDFQKHIEDWTNFFEIIQQKNSLNEQENNQVKDQAWNSLVQNKLIEKECKELGLSVSDAEVAEVLQSGMSQFLQAPVFMNQQGRYDYSQVQNFLSEYKSAKESGQQIPEAYTKIYNYYLFAQNQIRSQLLATKYQTLLASCILSNKVEAKQNFEARNTQSTLLLASVPFTSVDDKDIEVTDADLKAKYDEKKEYFRQHNETRDIKLLDIFVKPSAADKANAQKEIEEYYTKLADATTAEAAGNVVRQSTSLVPYSNILKTKDAFPTLIASTLDSLTVGATSKPVYDPMTNVFYTMKLIDKETKADSILFRQIGVIGKDANDIATKADSILNALAAGAKFKDIAKKYNQAGDSTWIASANYQNAQLDADNALFISTLANMTAGQTKKLALENGNTVILQVLSTKNPVAKYNLAAVVKELKFSDETYSNEYNKFSSFIAANTTLAEIEANAEKSGYTLRPINDISSSNHGINNLRNTRDALKWVFDEAKEGDVSQLYECGENDHLMLVALTGINPEGYTSLDKVKDNITTMVKADKKAEKILASCANVNNIASAKSVKGAIIDTLNHVTFADVAFIPTTASREPVVSGLAARTEKNAFAAPTKGNAGVYMFQVLDKKTGTEKMDEKSEKTTAAQMNTRMAMNSVFSVLYLNSDIKDLRYKFF